MAVNGVGVQQQIPLSQPFQPGGNQQVQKEEPKQKRVESQSQTAAQSNKPQKEEEENLIQQLLREVQSPASERTAQPQQAQKRGSMVDVTV